VATESEAPLCTTRDQDVGREWALVLRALGIPYRVGSTAGGWLISVEAAALARAGVALGAYERENAPRPEPAAEFEYGWSAAPLAAAALAIGFHGWLVESGGTAWLRAGRASAFRIFDGELWRAVTALTLHADAGHVLGNAVSGTLFGSLLCRRIGAGLGVWVALFGGIVGNLVNALLHGPPHNSIGASTAVFAAVGGLGGVAAVRGGDRAWRGRRRWWVPLGASFAVLALAGSQPDSDIFAHLFGLTIGAGAGAAVAAWGPEAVSPRTDAGLLWLAGVVVVGAWTVALAAR
jgi:membrane associated rhomboid family serine protease